MNSLTQSKYQSIYTVQIWLTPEKSNVFRYKLIIQFHTARYLYIFTYMCISVFAGNTCYLNSVLQVLRYTPEFVCDLKELSKKVARCKKEKEKFEEENVSSCYLLSPFI